MTIIMVLCIKNFAKLIFLYVPIAVYAIIYTPWLKYMWFLYDYPRSIKLSHDNFDDQLIPLRQLCKKTFRRKIRDSLFELPFGFISQVWHRDGGRSSLLARPNLTLCTTWLNMWVADNFTTAYIVCLLYRAVNRNRITD